MTSTKSSSGSAEALAGSSLAGGGRRAGRGRGGAGAGPGGGAPQTGPRRARTAREGRARRASHGAAALLAHDFAVAFRQLTPFLLVAMATFAVAMPVSTAAVPDASIFNLDYTHDQMKFRFWAEGLTYPVVVGASVYGVALGVRAFRFLLVKCESTAVLSLPLSRLSLFGSRCAACLAALLAGIGVPLAASLAVNVAALNVWQGLFGQFGYVLCGLLLVGAVACALSVLACAAAGTVAEAAAFAAALLASVSVAAWGLNAVMDHLLVGNAFGELLTGGSVQVAPSLLEALAPVNPLLFFAQEAADHQQFLVQHPVYYPLAGNWPFLGAWACALAALVALGAWRFCRRKGERAGIAGLNVALALVVGIVVGLAAFGATFTLLAEVGVAVAVAGSFAVFWTVSAVLFRGPLKGRSPARRTLAVVGAETAALACVLAVVAAGGLGYAQAVPAASEVRSVSVSYTGSPSYLAARLQTATAGEGSYYFSAEYSFDDAEAVEAVRGVHESLVGTGGTELGEDRADVGGTVVPYDVVVRYRLVDGGELVRYYDRATLDELAALAELDGTERGRNLARGAVSGDLSGLEDADAQAIGASSARQAYALGDIYLADRLYTAPMLVNCDAQARAELLDALAADVAGQSAQDRYHPEGACRGVIMFTQQGDAAAETFAYGIENAVVYLTDEFERTLAWLEEKGLSPYVSLDDAAACVEEVTVQRWAPFEGMNEVTEPRSAYFMGYRADVEQRFVTMQDFGTKFSTDDAGQISELLGLAKNTLYLDGGGYLLSCKLAGQEAWAYLVVSAEDAPEWLIRVAG